ncbi:MAG: acyltransferase [Ferruginibacter sp.]
MMSLKDTTNTKFDSLDALRFIAFIRIFLLHIPNSYNLPLFEKIKTGGEIGVDFFFVLSGFLITYLLAKEKYQSGTVDAKRFMMRRIFRIWPLYYLGVSLAYANYYIGQHYGLGNHLGYNPNILFSATFTENIKMIMEDNFPNGAPLRVFWSLCVEEQFYILWIILFKFVPLKHILKVFGGLIITAWCYRILITPLLHNTMMTDTDLISKLDYFCIGGALAICMVTYPSVTKKMQQLLNPQLQLPILCACFFFFFFVQVFPQVVMRNPIYFPTLSAIVFTVLIASMVLPGAVYHISNHSLLGKWGNMSYGLYVYHTPVILALLMVFKPVQGGNAWLYTIGFTLSAFIITLLISYASYYFFEKPFLNVRSKYFPKTA